MGRILIIPDVHGRTFWKEPVKKYLDECEQIVFLGDELDPYSDEEEKPTRKQSMAILDEIIKLKKENKDKVTLLIGNHAAHYMWRDFGKSSRFDSSNAYHNKETYLSNKTLFKVAWDKMIGDTRYLLTHAGVMRSWYERHKDKIGELTADNLNASFDVDAWSEYSNYRGWGGYNVGSPMWSDVRERLREGAEEKENFEGIYNIFAHTRLNGKPIIRDKWACIDCRKAFILDEEGNLTEAQ